METNPAHRRTYGRLAWLDELRTIAILLMVVDHALLFFAPEVGWAVLVRSTLTRCAEPLFVFVLASLSIHLRRPMRFSRWVQIVTTSCITSFLLSLQLGFPLIDVLASLAIAALALPALLSAGRAALLVVLYGSSAVSVVPVSLAGASFDYSPLLIVYQVALVRLFWESSWGGRMWHAVVSAGVVVVAVTAVLAMGVENVSLLLVVCVGHPLAVLWVRFSRTRGNYVSTVAVKAARKPLTVYGIHLVALAFLARLLL